MSESDLWKSNEYLRERNEELEQQSKETEKKIINLYNFIVKHNKQSPVMIKDNILKRFEKEFPEYFKESD